MKKTIIFYEVENISPNANNLYKFIYTLCHSISRYDIHFEDRDSSLFCTLFNCTDTEYLNALQELKDRQVIADDDECNYIELHPNIILFVEDIDYEP